MLDANSVSVTSNYSLFPQCASIMNSTINFTSDQSNVFKNVFETNADSQRIQYIKDLINGQQTTSPLKSLIFSLLSSSTFYLVFIVFPIILLAFFIFTKFNKKSRRLCFNTEGNHPRRTKILILTCLTLTVISICFSVGVIVITNRTVDSTYSAECQILSLIAELDYGSLKMNWIGIRDLNAKIVDVINSLSSIKNKSQDTFQPSNFITPEEYDNYTTFLNSTYNKLKSFTVQSPNPVSIGNITPGFIEYFGPISKNDSTISLLQYEFDQTISQTQDLVSKLQQYINFIISKIDLADSAFNKIRSILVQLSTTISTLKDGVVSVIQTYNESVVFLIRDLSTGIIICLIILIIVLLGLVMSLLFYKLAVVRISINVIWVIITILIMLLFVLSALFGFVSSAYLFVQPLLSEFRSNEDMLSMFSDNSQLIMVVENCLSDNTNLTSVFSQDLDILNYFNLFFVTNNKIRSLVANITSIDESLAITQYKKYYNELSYNIEIDMKTGPDSPFLAMAELNQYTDRSTSKNNQEYCKQKLYDRWVSDKKKCTLYPYYLYFSWLSQSYDTNLLSASCLSIDEWTVNQVKMRYSSISCSNYNVGDIASNYINTTSTYKKEALPIIQSVITELDNILSINTQYISHIKKFSENIMKVFTLTDPILQIFKIDVNGQKVDLFDLLDCGFLNTDLKLITYYFQDSGFDFYYASILCGLSAFIFMSTLLCYLVYYNLSNH